MRLLLIITLVVLVMSQPVCADTFKPVKVQNIIATPQIKLVLPPTKIDYTKLDKPGPVNSPDPYFTLSFGDNRVYRDAKDPTLAYYQPIIRLGVRAGTPMAEGVGDLASELDGFLFKYYKFESGGNPKWANMHAVVVVEQPKDVTLEAVQERWRDVTRLIQLPIRFDTKKGVKMRIPYPERTVAFTELQAQGGINSDKWYYFTTNTKPTPPDLLTDVDNSTLNETKARDFISLITSDLSDMPSFQPTLEITVDYPCWTGISPVSRNIIRFKTLTPMKITPSGGGPGMRNIVVPGKGLMIAPVQIRKTVTPVKIANEPARSVMMVNPSIVRVIGTLAPRKDIEYTYAASNVVVTKIPISYAKENAKNYDFYFLSDSGRFGGPYLEPSLLPDRPQLAQAPEGFTGYWYESHFLGRRMVWPAPRQLRLRWEVESGLRPSCRFSTGEGEEGKLYAHITYDLYPDFSTRQLGAALDAIKSKTGEEVQVYPFTDIIDANNLILASANPELMTLASEGKISIIKLTPQRIDDAWFRVTADMPIEDWSEFTLFMKMGDLGSWDMGVKTGASSGIAEKVNFSLTGDLLQTMGGPLVASKKSFDPATGGYEIALDSYWMAPMEVKGIRFEFSGAEAMEQDVWLESPLRVPGVGSSSSFDQTEGAAEGESISVKEAASQRLKDLMASGKYSDLSVGLAADMIAPSSAPEDAGGIDPDIAFSFLRSLCYQYIGSSEIISVPVAPLETSQWLGYKSGRIIVRFQGFVYTKDLDLSAQNSVDIRRLPREGAYAFSGKPGDADLLEYRAVFVKDDGTVVEIPSQTGESRWLTSDISGININMMGE